MIGVYAPQDVARRVIQGVTNMHARVQAKPSRRSLSRARSGSACVGGGDGGLGFVTAYDRFAAPLTDDEKRRFFIEGAPVAKLYGVQDPIASSEAFGVLLAQLLPRFEPHPIIFEFLDIVQSHPGALRLPKAIRRAIARGAVSLLPQEVRATLTLDAKFDLSSFERRALKLMGAAADRAPIPNAPPADACRRMGLPADFLYRSRGAQARILARKA